MKENKKISRIKFLLHTFLIILPFSLSIVSCSPTSGKDYNKLNTNSKIDEADKFLKNDLKRSFNFFQDFYNKNQKGFGLVPDRVYLGQIDNGASSTPQSSDAIGFKFVALAIGSEKGWIKKDDAKLIAEKLSDTVLKLKHFNGYITHFTDRSGKEWVDKDENGRIISSSEESSITTGLILQGMVVADSYFKSSKITQNLQKLVERIPWDYNTNIIAHGLNKDWIRMSSNNQVYSSAKWDWYAEQQMLYLIAAANSKVSEIKAKKLYSSFERHYHGTGENKFVKESGGTLFTYQFSSQFIDFKNLKTIELDPNWWENSKRATKYDMEFSKKRNQANNIENPDLYWGVSAQDSINGYIVNGVFKGTDDTYAPWGQVGSIEYFPNEVKKSIYSLINHKFQGAYNIFHPDYGLYDGYNMKNDWVAHTILTIDKGLEMVALSNYYDNNFVRKLFMENDIIKKAIKKLGWQST